MRIELTRYRSYSIEVNLAIGIVIVLVFTLLFLDGRFFWGLCSWFLFWVYSFCLGTVKFRGGVRAVVIQFGSSLFFFLVTVRSSADWFPNFRVRDYRLPYRLLIGSPFFDPLLSKFGLRLLSVMTFLGAINTQVSIDIGSHSGPSLRTRDTLY